jgi:hypothetical protein
VRVRDLIVLLVVASRVALAQPPSLAPAPGADSPWSAGIPAEEQTLALDLYSKGNVEFESARFDAALALYAQALQHWDHPAIRYNMAIAYNNLGQLLDAEDNLRKALRFGEGPLGQRIYVLGLEYMKNFESRLARVSITCSEPETQISLDGRLLFVGPGTTETLVLPGEHLIVGEKPGYLTVSERLELAPGAKRNYDVRLIALKPQTRMVRRWQWWKPWMVSGIGAGIVALGGVAYLAARQDINSYDAGISARCPHGCDGATLQSFDDLESDRSRSHIESGIALSLFIAGGATIAAGIIGVGFNQPREERVIVTPTPSGGSLAVRWSF